jgi:N-carbamoylputrescine amidase
MRCTADRDTNLLTAIARTAEAARAGADIVCLPELFLSPYFCQREDPALFDLAEPIPGPSTAALADAAKTNGVVLVASLFERRARGVFHNTAVVFDADGTMLGRYRKMHIPHDPLFYEKYYFTPGDLGFQTFATKPARVGTLVCWDQWFPEAARLTSLKGAELLVYPTAIGWHPREKAESGTAQHDAWETSMRGHAIANGVFVAAVNRVGHEGPVDGGLEFWGASFVCDPFGVVLKRGSHDREELMLVQCDRSRLEDVSRNWPFRRDRRIDAYDDITRRFID